MPIIQKVTDPAKIVTDELVLKRLAEQDIDPDYVEFWHDYAPRSKGKEYSPYAKFYRDLKSGKRIMAVSGLPKVKPDGRKIEVGWIPPVDTPAGRFHSKPNLFSAIVEGKQVKLTVLSDQPDGTKRDEQVTWRPQLFVDGSEIINGEQATLLPVDPINPNYKENTLEWAYGTVCKRRIRIIEGRFRERWLFESNPHSSIRIKHNFVGSLKLKLGYAQDAEGNPLKVSVIGDEEIIEASELDKAIYPVEIGGSLTVYPDTDSAGADGYCRRYYAADHDWDDIHDGAGTSAEDAADDFRVCYIRAEIVSPNWEDISRGAIVFPIAGTPDGCTITATTLYLYGYLKWQNAPFDPAPDLNIYSVTLASPTAVAAGDYVHTNWGTTPYCDTTITYAAFNAGTPGTANEFAFNADPGIVAVQAASDGNTVLYIGLRNANYDVADSAPSPHPEASVSDGMRVWASEKGTGFKPKLVVTYTVIEGKSSSDSGAGVDAKKAGEPKATYSRSETGSGVEAMPARGITLPDSGSGVEHILDRALVLISESGSGVDTVLSLLGKIVTESGTGVENSYLHILEGVKDSSDSGSGVEASSLTTLLQRDEVGEGVESVVARALYAKEYPTGAIDLARVITAVITGAETGTGAEASLVAFYQKKADSGEGVDASTLTALFTGEDSGVGAEAITLLAAMVAHDTGVSVESVLSFFKKAIDSGQGVENLHLVGFVGRAMKLITYLLDYSDMTVYTKPYSDLRVYTSEVKQ